MKYSEILIPTLREAPNDAEVISHKLMLRAGYIRKLAAGVYTYLPLCLRVIRKIEKIVREEMEKNGAHELLLPIVMPSELWTETGRWDYYGKELLRFKDRHNRDFCIGPTHEEAITDLFRQEISSYRDLPKNAFQIQTKFRDEIRPRFGLMRGREFIMKDGYSFDRDQESSLVNYQKMYEAYKNIFSRLGLKYRPVEAMTGNIGGSKSHEFQVLASSGEDAILACDSCEYAANIEKAEVKKQEVKSASKEKGKYKKIATPGKGSIEEVSGFLKKSANEFVKTLLFETDQGPIAVLLRGDHELMEAKLQVATAAKWCHLAEDKTVQEITKAKAGFSGPIGLTLPVYADYAVESMSNFVVGANETDMHFTEANLSDFEVKGFFDLRAAQEGNACARCEKGKYEMHRGIEVGQVFYLGTKYSESMNAVYLDENQKKQFIEMGCYGIGIGRTAAAAIEQNHDERGIIWPKAIAPFQFHLISLAEPGSKAHVFAEELHKQLEAKGMEVLFDERKARAGVKFADADLIGIPYQITIGEKGLEKQIVECKARQTGEKSEFSVHGLLDHLLSLYT